MNHEHHVWYSHRLGRNMGVRVHGQYGMPILAFPTSMGDEWEYEGQGMIGALAHHIESGRVKFFCVNSINNDSWNNKGAHPRHRSYMQAVYNSYICNEVFPFIREHCRTPGIGITTTGSSLGAFHAANTLFKHPADVKRTLALSGVYDMKSFMDGDYDDNFYFNNPVDYLSNLSDPYYYHHLMSCDVRLATGCGPWENSGASYRLCEVLCHKGIPHSLDDWGFEGGHDWPFWKRQMDQYIGRLF